MVLKEFASSLLLIISWLLFALSAYALYWSVVIPGLALIPFLVLFVSALLSMYLSMKLVGKRRAG
ncbi:hypothetical protein NCCP2222_25190 [Sporosarcina sp. NCCP-2222]|nr:hypothetical protein NCCP2222_25190 [Sporosarcina sp. NCCP-2222]